MSLSAASVRATITKTLEECSGAVVKARETQPDAMVAWLYYDHHARNGLAGVQGNMAAEGLVTTPLDVATPTLGGTYLGHSFTIQATYDGLHVRVPRRKKA